MSNEKPAKATTKTISMSWPEYQAELAAANVKGYAEALTVVKHVLEGKIVKRGEGTTDEEWSVWEKLMERAKSEKTT